jgi:poly(3-hydroxybutyrate) depolymerase
MIPLGRLAAAACLVALTSAGTAAATAPPEGAVAVWHEQSLEVGGATRWFRVHVPRADMHGAPAVVVLHGGAQSMREIFERNAGGSQAWRDVADR